MVIITVIIVFISLLLVAVVLLQKSKGGGLAAGFQSQNALMGAPKTANFLEKLTWSLMGIIAVLCICCTLILSNNRTFSGSAVEAKDAAPTLPEQVSDVPATPAATDVAE